MSDFYVNIMKRRREAGESTDHDDMISALQNQSYKDGRPLGDREVAHIMIALLMAGQHTSAATGSWLMLHLAERPEIVAELRQEQEKVFGKSADGTYGPLDYDQLHTPLLIGCIKEVLRLHPPIHSIMRKVRLWARRQSCLDMR